MTFNNSKKLTFLQSFPEIEFDSDNCNHAARSKFNFSYFDHTQDSAQNFDDWSAEQVCKLLEKLKEYGKFPLQYWMTKRCGGGGLKVLEIYGGFPLRSEFTHPKYIPKNVRWARFRLEGDMRLIGFIIPSDLEEKISRTSRARFDGNVFYVVFLDQHHKFYLSSKG